MPQSGHVCSCWLMLCRVFLRAQLLSEIVFIPNFTCLTQLIRQLSQRNVTLHINFMQSPLFNIICKILSKKCWMCLKIYHHKVSKSLSYVKRRDGHSSITSLRVNHCVTAGCKNQRKCQSALHLEGILYVQGIVHHDKLRITQPTRCIKYSKFILS